MRKIRTIKFLLLTGVIIIGMILGSMFTSTNVEARRAERKVCHHCLGVCVPATFENECGTCKIIPELCKVD